MSTKIANQTLYQVRLKNGRVWTGTEQELRTYHPKWVPYAEQLQPIRITRQDETPEEEGEYDDPHPGRLPTSSRKYINVAGQNVRYEMRPDQVIPRRAHAQPQTRAGDEAPATEEPKALRQKRQRRGWHPLWYLGLGMIVMLLLWQGLTAFTNWWQVHSDDSTYGRPRTFQIDAVVGHNGDSAANPSHFIFLNLKGHIEVIEFPAGDGSKAKIYLGPTIFTDGGDLIPVTGEFADVNGDGKPDMILKIQDQRIVFINTGDGFRPLKPGEHVTIPQH